MAPKIDHIIIKLPYGELQNPPKWLTKNFTLTTGGRHADGKTENKLIVFQDGSYIELIAFVNDDPENRKGHWWGDLDFGLIDWALTSASPDDVKEVNRKIESAETGLDVRYSEPQEGGRKRPDGKKLEWKVTFPEHIRRGEAPFWCHDLTPRELRVPRDVNATTHPSGAVGVGLVKLLVPPAKIEPLKKFYGAVVGSEGSEKGGLITWEIEVPVRIEKNLAKPSIALETPTLKFEQDEAKGNFTIISEISLLTDTVGLGQSRDTLVGAIGGNELTVSFLHGRSA